MNVFIKKTELAIWASDLLALSRRGAAATMTATLDYQGRKITTATVMLWRLRNPQSPSLPFMLAVSFVGLDGVYTVCVPADTSAIAANLDVLLGYANLVA